MNFVEKHFPDYNNASNPFKSASGSSISSVGSGLDLTNKHLSLTFNPTNLIHYISSTNNPTTNDTNYVVGQLWVNTNTSKAYILCALSGGVALWKEITNTTSDTLPALNVYPTESSIVVRSAGGAGYFTNVYLNALANATRSKVIKVSNNSYQGSLTGELIADDITGSDINTASDLNIHSLRLNGQGAGTLVTDANGFVSAQNISLTTTPTFTSINGTGNTNVNFLNGLATNAISSYDTMKITMNHDLYMAGTRDMYLATKSYNFLGTDANGKIISTSIPDALTPSAGWQTINGSIKLGSSTYNEILCYNNNNPNKIIFYDNRGGGSTPANFHGIGMASSATQYNVNTNNTHRFTMGNGSSYVTIAELTNGNGLAVNKIKELTASSGVTFNSVIKADTIQEATASAGVTINSILNTDSITPPSGTLTVNGNVVFSGTNEIKMANNLDMSRIILWDSRATSANTNFCGLGVDSGTFLFNNRVNTDKFQFAYADTTTTRKAMFEVKSDGIYVDGIKELTTGSGVTVTSLKTDTITPPSGTLMVNGDVKLKVAKELIFERTTDEETFDSSKIVLWDQRGTNAVGYWWGIGSGKRLLTDGTYLASGTLQFHSRNVDRAFQFLAGVDGAANDVLECEIISNILKINNISSLTTNNLVIQSPLTLTGNTYTSAGYLYRNTDGTTTIQTPAAATAMSTSATANTGVLRDGSGDITTSTQLYYSTGSSLGSNLDALALTHVYSGTGTTNVIKFQAATGSLYKYPLNTYTSANAFVKQSLLDMRRFTIGEPDTIIKNSSGNPLDGAAHKIHEVFMHGVWEKPLWGATRDPMYVDENGRVGTYSLASSRAVKEDIATITDDVVEKTYSLNPVSFKYKADPLHRNEFGLIAEEVEQLLGHDFCEYHPETKEIRGIKYNFLPTLAIAGIKKLKSRIDNVEQENQMLKADNELLKSQVDSLKTDVELIKKQLLSMTQPNIKYVTSPQSVNANEMIIYENTDGHLLARWRAGSITKEIDLIN